MSSVSNALLTTHLSLSIFFVKLKGQEMREMLNFDDMPLTSALQEWMQQSEWDDEIEVKDDRQFARVETRFGIDDQPHRLFLECRESTSQFSIYMYSPYNIPTKRMSDACRILNNINFKWRSGRLACLDDDDANPVQYLWTIDVEGSALEPLQIQNMLNAATSIFEEYGSLLAQVALTKIPAADIWNEYVESQKNQPPTAPDNSDVPREL